MQSAAQFDNGNFKLSIFSMSVLLILISSPSIMHSLEHGNFTVTFSLLYSLINPTNISLGSFSEASKFNAPVAQLDRAEVS